jgi:hypothetical protein
VFGEEEVFEEENVGVCRSCGQTAQETFAGEFASEEDRSFLCADCTYDRDLSYEEGF